MGKYNKILKKSAKKFWQNKICRGVLFGFCFLIVGLAVLFFGYNLAYQEKTLPRTYIGGEKFGGLTRSQAEEKISQLIDQNQTKEIFYSWENKKYTISLNDLEVNYTNLQHKTVEDLFAVGKKGNVGKILVEIWRSLVTKNQVRAVFTFNYSRMDDYLVTISKDIDRPEKDASIVIKDLTPVVTPEEVGRKFDLIANRQIMLNALGEFNLGQTMLFKINQIHPKIDTKTAQGAVEKTNQLLARQLTVTAKDKTYQLGANEIAPMIDFVASLGQDSILAKTKNSLNLYSLNPEISSVKTRELVDKINSEIYQEPKEPKFEVSSGKVSAFQVGQTGYELDKDQSVNLIIKSINDDAKTVDLPVKITESQYAAENPDQIGLKELIGEGTSSWRGSPSNRIHNLTLGANKISGHIVKPGEEFSTITVLKPIDASAGYLPELVIKNSNQVTPEYGGGLCQVSTTLFRAVLNSGLQITARTPHSFRVSYYEPPAGMDATVYDPAPDFKFINNMTTPIFIWAVAGNNSLDFQIYGTKDGRKIEVSDPVLFDYTSPGAEIYTMSESMGPGEIRQVERATNGATASFTYKVTSAGGEVLQSETYVSKYVPVPNSYLYGPGTEGIPGQEAPAPQVEATAVPAPTASPTPTPTPKPTKKR